MSIDSRYEGFLCDLLTLFEELAVRYINESILFDRQNRSIFTSSCTTSINFTTIWRVWSPLFTIKNLESPNICGDSKKIVLSPRIPVEVFKDSGPMMKIMWSTNP